MPRQLTSTLFPYTTLFRSLHADDVRRAGRRRAGRLRARAHAQPWADDSTWRLGDRDRKSTRLNSSHLGSSYAVFCLKTKNLLAPNRVAAFCTIHQNVINSL